MNSTSTRSTRSTRPTRTGAARIGGLGMVALLAIGCGDDASPSDDKPDSGAQRDSGSLPRDSGTRPDGGGSSPDSGPNTSPDAGPVSPFIAKLTSCGILSAGKPVHAEPPDSPEDECIGKCELAASCEDLSLGYCDNMASSSVQACIDACAIECVLVAGESDSFNCDGQPQCEGATDEANCDSYYFTCTDGSKINKNYLCDDAEDCPGGEDQANCPAEFACGDGTKVPARYVCDVEEDCANGADEEGCAALSCE